MRPAHPGRKAGDAGEGDSAGGPRTEGAHDWPTLIVEGGDSESFPQLHNDLQWWFAASDYAIKIALFVRFDPDRDRILIEKWEEEHVPNLPGPQSGTLQPVRRQEVTISRNQGGAYDVAEELVLEFWLLFLREPDMQKGETDVVIDVPGLQWHAERVWMRIPGAQDG